MPVAGGGGDRSHDRAASPMVAAGNPSDRRRRCSDIRHSRLRARQVPSATSTETATKEGWDKVCSRPLCRTSPTMTANGLPLRSTCTRPTGSGSTRPPSKRPAARSRQDLRRPGRTARQGQGCRRHYADRRTAVSTWQDATIFDADRALRWRATTSTRRPSTTSIRKSRSAADKMKEVLRQPMTKLTELCRPRTSPAATGTLRPPWSSKGEARAAGHGRLGQGRIPGGQAGRRAPTSSACRFPGTHGSGDLTTPTMFAMFKVPDDRQGRAGRSLPMATALASPTFQSAFNVVKGSVPARTDVPDTDFRRLRQEGVSRISRPRPTTKRYADGLAWLTAMAHIRLL